MENKKLKSDITNKIDYYGHGIPYFRNIEIKGKLIVIEGPDSSGRQYTNIITKFSS